MEDFYVKGLISYDLQFFADDASDKTEEPTGKKLDEAKSNGQFAKSREIGNAFGLLALFLSLKIFIGSIGTSLLELFEGFYSRIPDTVDASVGGFSLITSVYYLRQCLLKILSICGPIYVIGVIVAMASTIIQIGWNVTTKPMQPKLSKINPSSGFKRIFSKDSLFELFKSILKMAVIAIVAYNYIKGNMDFLFVLYDIPLWQAIGIFGSLSIDLGIRIGLVFIIVGVVDFIYQKHKFHKDMMMTKQEVKDEAKNAEGSPEVKNAQKQKMREASRRRMMQAVPQADVIITNPTHLAVALSYTPGVDDAPIVVAKGEDYLARRIKEVGRENGVEIVEDKPLARMLYSSTEVGDPIPAELYEAVADILVHILQLKNKI